MLDKLLNQERKPGGNVEDNQEVGHVGNDIWSICVREHDEESSETCSNEDDVVNGSLPDFRCRQR